MRMVSMLRVCLACIVVLAASLLGGALRPALLSAEPVAQDVQPLLSGLDAIQASLTAGDIQGAKASYDRFEGRWESIENTVRARSRDAYRDIEDAMRTLRDAIYNGSGDPSSALNAVRGQINAYAGQGPAPASAAPRQPSAPAAAPQQPENALVV